jgi:TolB protein
MPRARRPFAYWRGHGTKVLLGGRLSREKDRRLKVVARLWDVAGGRYLTGQQYFVEPEHRSRLAHIIADMIYSRLTGRDGRFEADNLN